MHTCPHDIREFETLAGWKSHMTRAHGGYSDDELSAAAGVTSTDMGDVKQRMSDFAESMLGSETPTAADVAPPPSQAPPIGKRIKATPKKLKKLISSIPAKLFTAYGITPDDEDKESIEEAVEFVQDIFGVEFQVPEDKFVVRNRLMAFAWVIGVILLVFVKHKFGELFKLGDTGETPPVEN